MVFPFCAKLFKTAQREPPVVRMLKQRAGLEDVRLHDLRHTCASQAILKGISIPTIARLLGHAQPDATLRHAHVDDRHLAAAAQQVGDGFDRIIQDNDALNDSRGANLN